MHSIIRLGYLALVCAIELSAPTIARAQTINDASQSSSATQPPPKSTPASTKLPTVPVGTMSTIVVTGPSEASVLPSDAPVSSVFGNDLPVQDTPRTVTVLTKELLQDYNVTNLQDLSKTAPSAYLTDQYGGYSVPNIRGQLAEVFINGMQSTTRNAGPPTSFNSIDSAQLVAGPASSVYGPSANVGGYVNFVTKQPYFDRWHSDTSFTYGSYDEKIWTEDFGAPIIPGQLAFRASYEGIDSGSYYNNVESKSQDGFFALAYVPSSDFHVDFNTEFQDVRFDQLTGFNRPTQDLISNHNYTAGPYDFLGIPPSFIGGVVAPPSEQRLSDSSTVMSPQDSDYGKVYNAQLTETYDPGDGFSLINRTYYENEYVRNSDYASAFTSLVNSNIVEDRLEFHADFDTPLGEQSPASKTGKIKEDDAQLGDPLSFKHSIVAGLAFKSVSLNNYEGYYNEAFNVTDLSTGTYPLATSEAGFFNTYPIPGSNLYGSPGGNYGTGFNSPGSINEQAEEASAFFQHNVTFTPHWSMLYGGRLDAIFDNVSDSLPPPGFAPVSDNTIAVEPSANVSVNYKPATWITNYLTLSFSESYPGNSGGGFNYFNLNNNLGGDEYHLQNFLYEGGSKLDLLDHSLFLTADAYYQTHYVTTSFGATSQVRVVGSELQETYQPDKHFFLSMNQSYMLATVVNPTAEATELNSDITNPSPNGGTPNYITPPAGDYREGGLPSFMLNGIASYKWDFGLGVSMNYEITDPIPVSEVDSIWIPWQYQIDASVFYAQKNWEARVNFYNITDQHNWSTGGYIAGTGNDLITLQEPFHWEAKLTYKF